jgi:serine/threonine protein kinase/formylglycine-generating enzyme required for sulfatase activity
MTAEEDKDRPTRSEDGGVPGDSSEGFYDQAASSPNRESFGPYTVRGRIGEGTFGEVFLAEQAAPFYQRVALKVIKQGMASADILARFEAERQALALMNHPSIARVLDAGTSSEGRPFFVLEHVPGIPLTEYCDRNRLGTQDRLDLFTGICRGVQHAHQRGIIHRDLKPANILVTIVDGLAVPKIIDFGVAKALYRPLTGGTPVTEIGMAIGTIGYMSPEQVRTDALDIDTRADIYSLGAILYELLTGVLPHEPEKLREAGYRGIRGIFDREDPPKPSTRVHAMRTTSAGRRSGSRKAGSNETVPHDRTAVGAGDLATRRDTDLVTLERQIRGDLDWISMKALQRDRTRRYASASELAADIERHLNSEPVTAGPPSFSYKARKLLVRHRREVAGLLAGTVLAVIAAIGASGLVRSRLEAAREAETERICREAEAGAGDYLLGYARFIGLHETIRSSHAALEGRRELWRPPWERPEETAAWEEIRGGMPESLADRHSEVLAALASARDRLPPDSPRAREIAGRIEDVMRRHPWRSLLEGIEINLDSFSFLRRSLAERERPSPATFRISLRSSPSGARVHVFRYRGVEGALLPIPFDPVRGGGNPKDGFVSEPFLQVRKVTGNAKKFDEGDLILRIQGVEISTPGDLARTLKGKAIDEPVEVEVEGKGGIGKIAWMPFPASRYRAKDGDVGKENLLRPPLEPGRLIDTDTQFDFLLAGYPLRFPESAIAGTIEEGKPLEVVLPPGSYLFVLRKEGFADARVPLALPPPDPKTGTEIATRLVRLEDVPPGFAYIPAGPVRYGGDALAYLSLPPGATEVPGFFMKADEVTLREYLEFLNDPEVRGRIDGKGRAIPRYGWDPERGEAVATPSPPADAPRTLLLVPDITSDKRRIVIGDPTSGWNLLKEGFGDLPAYKISLLAAVEYAEWLTAHHGGRWRFRLPRDLEWERAARGADARAFVWGDYFFGSFCSSQDGRYPERSTILPAGSSPFDESVFGVRDLAGSLSEPILAAAPANRHVLRGGNWSTTDLRDFRIATRNHRLPDKEFTDVGIRLVADLPVSGN